MTQIGQDFSTYAGDDVSPIVTVVDDNGNPINLSTVLEITWTAQRDLNTAAAITKTLSSGQITLPSGGADGRFQVFLLKTDTAPLGGYYFHSAEIKDSASQVSTVMTGRFQVGAKPIWTYSGDPSTSNKDAVRYLVGDIIETDKQVYDAEINFTISQTSSIYRAAAMVCRSLASKLSREADTVDKDIRDAISQRARAYSRMAVDYDKQASVRGGGLPYAGGISIADKQRQQNNTDRVLPQFNLGEDDNYIPISPSPNETQY